MTKRNLTKKLKEQFEKLLPDFSFKKKVVEAVTPEAEMLKAQERAKVKATFTSKRAIMSFVATCLIVCIGLGVGLGIGLKVGVLTPDGEDSPIGGGGSPTGGVDPAPAPTYMSIDINPSFGIEVDEVGVVVSVEALNEDAVIVLLDTNLVGKTVEEVFTSIVSLAKELGYLKENGTVNVVMSNEFKDVEEAIATRVESVLDDVNALLSAENITINIEKGKEALVSAIEEAGKFVEGMEDWSAEHLHKYFKDYDSEKIDAFVADVKAQGEEIRANLEEEYAKLKPIADKIVDAYNKKDYVSFALAILDASEYIAMYIDSAELGVTLDEFGAFILGSPEMVGDFCAFLEDMAGDNHSDEIEDMILNQIKGQLKDRHDKESGVPDGQKA